MRINISVLLCIFAVLFFTRMSSAEEKENGPHTYKDCSSIEERSGLESDETKKCLSLAYLRMKLPSFQEELLIARKDKADKKSVVTAILKEYQPFLLAGRPASSDVAGLKERLAKAREAFAESEERHDYLATKYNNLLRSQRELMGVMYRGAEMVPEESLSEEAVPEDPINKRKAKKGLTVKAKKTSS